MKNYLAIVAGTGNVNEVGLQGLASKGLQAHRLNQFSWLIRADADADTVYTQVKDQLGGADVNIVPFTDIAMTSGYYTQSFRSILDQAKAA